MADLKKMQEILIAKCKEELEKQKKQPKAKVQPKVEKKETKVGTPFVFKKK